METKYNLTIFLILASFLLGMAFMLLVAGFLIPGRENKPKLYYHGNTAYTSIYTEVSVSVQRKCQLF